MRGDTHHGEPSTARLYRAALGGGSAARAYLGVFARFDDLGRAGPAWNSAAALFQLGWLVHHRLWLPAAWWGGFAVGAGLLMAGLWQLTAGWEFGVKLGLTLALALAVLCVPGLWGTAWLHTRLRQRMIAAVETAPTVDAACEALQAEARQRQQRNTWGLAVLSSGVLLAGLLGWRAPWRSTVSAEATATLPTAAPLQLAPEPVAPESTFVTEAQDTAVAPDLPDDIDGLGAEPLPATPPVSTVADTPSPVSAVQPAQADVVREVVTPKPKPKPQPTGELRARVKGHGVAVGMFGVEANAQRTVTKLRAAGLPVLSDPVASAKGTLTRVRVGPFERREKAEAAALKVKALGLDAKVYAP